MCRNVILLILLSVQMLEVNWSEALMVKVARNPNLVRFYLYNHENMKLKDGYELRLDEISSIFRAGLKASRPVKFIIHGFNHNHRCWFPQEIKDSYLYNGYNTNIITVDWGPLATPVAAEPFRTLAYPLTVQNVRTVGWRMTEFVSLLIEYGLVDLGSMHIIGFSLGAHIAGMVGSNLKRRFGRKVARITGLDPAGPFFYTGVVSRSLRRSDAKFVDVIHTDMTEYGHLGMLGHADFYVNGGKPPQPGCRPGDASCSHHAAANYFLQSIGHYKIRACPCGSYRAFRYGGCSCRYSTVFGANAGPESKGAYYLDMQPVYLSGRYHC